MHEEVGETVGASVWEGVDSHTRYGESREV